MIAIAVILLGVALGILRFSFWKNAPTDALLEQSIGVSSQLIGLVDDEPDVREGNTHLTIELRSIVHAGASSPVFGHVLLIVPRYPEYHYGDVLLLRGKLMRPMSFTEADGRVFDYPTYLASKGIRYQMSFAQIDRVKEGAGHVIRTSLFAIKSYVEKALGSALPEPHGALMSGLLLGGKQSLGAEWIEKFRTVGIVHIIVLSGYNMTIVATWLVTLFRFTGFVGSLSVGAIGIVLFAVMTGGGATVMRAAVMAILALIARATGRTYEMSRALLIAGALMVLHNPSILAFDPSFQLSFLASLGLVFVAPILEARLTLWSRTPWLREVLIATLATQIAVLPLLLSQTGIFSVVALPVNLLVLPVIPLAMFFGFIAGMIALLFPPLAFVAGLPSFALLSWILKVADHASRFPFAAVHVPAISLPITLLMYALLSIWIYRAQCTLTSKTSALPLSPQAPPSH
jgi:competence protein ComEC